MLPLVWALQGWSVSLQSSMFCITHWKTRPPWPGRQAAGPLSGWFRREDKKLLCSKLPKSFRSKKKVLSEITKESTHTSFPHLPVKIWRDWAPTVSFSSWIKIEKIDTNRWLSGNEGRRCLLWSWWEVEFNNWNSRASPAPSLLFPQ